MMHMVMLVLDVADRWMPCSMPEALQACAVRPSLRPRASIAGGAGAVT